MRALTVNETGRVHHLTEELMSQLARGREWATPGVQAAIRRAVAGLDSGLETASPRLQALLRQVSDELAGGVETLTPRVRAQLKRVGPKTPAPTRDKAARPAPKTGWWITGILALAAGAALWRSRQARKEEPVSSTADQEGGSTDPNVEADLAAGRM